MGDIHPFGSVIGIPGIRYIQDKGKISIKQPTFNSIVHIKLYGRNKSLVSGRKLGDNSNLFIDLTNNTDK